MRPFRNDLTENEMQQHLLRQAQTIGKFRSALEEIAALPPGSRAAYSKFSEAQGIARGALGEKE